MQILETFHCETEVIELSLVAGLGWYCTGTILGTPQITLAQGTLKGSLINGAFEKRVL